MIPHKRGRVETDYPRDHARRDLALALGLYGRESVSLCNMLLEGMSDHDRRYVLVNLAELARETPPHRSPDELLAELAVGPLRHLVEFGGDGELVAAGPWIILAFVRLGAVLPDADLFKCEIKNASRCFLSRVSEELARLAGDWSEGLESCLLSILEPRHG